MDGSNSACTPILSVNPPDSGGVEPLPEKEHNLYSSIVGSLMYIATCTRPIISFAVGELGRFTHQPTKAHLITAKRILRYLRGTNHLQITYNGTKCDQRPELIGYAGADFTSDLKTKRSVSSYIFTYGGSSIAWKSKKEGLIATSTSEAEYVSVLQVTFGFLSL